MGQKRLFGANRRTRALINARRRKLSLEALEDRRLLAALAGDEGYRNSDLIVKFRDGATARTEILGSTLGAQWAVAPGLRQVNLAPGYDIAEAIRVYQSDPNVEFAEPDYRVSLLSEPNDPQFFHQWDMTNGGLNGGTADADIDAPEAWDVTTGSEDVVVAVIDTGVDYNHPDLAANIWTNPGEIPGNKKDDDGNGYVDDVHGYDFANNDGDPMDDHFHGTHVAGTIGAVGDNGIGVTGVNWHVKIMALKFLDGTGSGYASDAIDALNYAVANGATVSNNSWGGGGESQAMETAIKNAAKKGHIFVAAAGNDGSNNDVMPFYPAGYKVANVVSVAASNNDDQLAYFSNYGKTTVDLAAPGQEIYSTLPTKLTQAMKDEQLPASYGTLSGTSMATPHVTGVIALVRSLHPDWTYQQVIDQVTSTVDVSDAFSETISGGRLNAAGAVGGVKTSPPDTTAPKVISSNPSGGVAGPVSSVHVRFSESIDVATFDLSDVASFDGPSGPLNVLSLAPVPNSNNREFALTFDEQTENGKYALVIGPDIRDLAGFQLDQNGDGLGGQFPTDQYTISFTIGGPVTPPPTTPPANDLPLPIGDELFVPVESHLTVDQDISITDLNVLLNITYPYDGDLQVTLTSPSGTTVTLTAFNGGMDSDFADTIFDDEASQSIVDGIGPYTGSYQPDGSGGLLSDFDGQSAKGVWTLTVVVYPFFGFLDGFGYLNSWSLQLSGDGGGTPPDNPPDNPPPGKNHKPVAVNDSIQSEMNVPAVFKGNDLLANDSDPDGDKIAISNVSIPFAYLDWFSSANGMITVTPETGFTGSISFDYTISDGNLTSTATVSVTFAATFQNHNSKNGFDVNNDGKVAPLDALLIINYLNAPKVSNPDSGISSLSDYFDVVADNIIAPLDALTIINFLNAEHNKSLQPSALAATAEGDSTDTAMATDATGSSSASSNSNSSSHSSSSASGGACDSPAAAVSQAAAGAAEPRRRLRQAVDYLMASDAIQKLLEDLNLCSGVSG